MIEPDVPSDDQFTREGRTRVDDLYEDDRMNERLEDAATDGQPAEDDPAART